MLGENLDGLFTVRRAPRRRSLTLRVRQQESVSREIQLLRSDSHSCVDGGGSALARC
jgi:hypothetical protein